MKKIMHSLFCAFTLVIALFFAEPGIVKAEETNPVSSVENSHPSENTNQSQDSNQQTKSEEGHPNAEPVPGQANVPVTEVEVKAPAVTKEGSAKNGYRSETVTSVGPLGSMKLQDTPYSINIMPQELLENVQASMPDALFKLNPFIQVGQPQVYGSQSTSMIRGFKVDNFNNVAQDGMLMGIALADIEDKERIEVLNGVAGFLYGPSSPGGTINYVGKRPTSTPLANVTVGNYGGSSYYVHGDFGGLLANKSNVAYRLNVVAQDGDTGVDYQSINRQLVSGALDWHLSDRALLQFDVAHHNYTIDGVVPKWTFASGVAYPSAPDSEKLWSQKFGYSNETMDKLGTRLTWNLNDSFTLRTGVGYNKITREAVQFNNSVTSSNGTYTQKMTAWAPWEYTFKTNYLALDSKFKTGNTAHNVTVGFYNRTLDLREHADNSASIMLSGSFNFEDPTYVTEPSYSVGKKSWADSSSTKYNNLVVSDNIQLNDKLSLLAGVNRADITTTNWNLTTGAVKSHYDKSKTVPTVSLIYKPAPLLTTYATFAEGLEKGGTAGSTTANSGETMPPLLSKQYEIGAKTTIGQTLFTAALFQIDKAYEYTDPTDNIFKQAGREIHKGIELSVTGKVTPNLILVGGLTFLRPTVDNDASNLALEGKMPVDVAKRLAKLYAEYNVAKVPGLTLTGGIYYTGRQAANTMNTVFLPGVTTFDLGVRYQTIINKTPVTYRLNVSNLFNKSYWANSSYTGYPRTIAVSAQFKL